LSTEIRTRFAPSPTGFLHIGGVRTALYNYLFAKRNKGKFILRIEDTDIERSEQAYTQIILDGLKWLGLEWDEGPFFQTKRLDLYKKALDKLIEKNLAYKCFCSPEELKQKRDYAIAQGRFSGYDGTCRNLDPAKVKEFQDRAKSFAFRLKTPDQGKIAFKDLIKGGIEVDAVTIGDFVLVKSSGIPAYNFACVVDDIDLEISHVIRGDDHVPNTPKQILLYNALEKEQPQFAHVPQVLGKDGKRLSKRTGAVSLDEYRKQGYLPEALRNYLVLIGWSTEDSQQIFGWDELIEKFDLGGCNVSAGIFDTEKLSWMNGKYLRKLPSRELAQRAVPWLEQAGLAGQDSITEAIELEKEKFFLLKDIPDRIGLLVKEEIEYDEEAVQKRLKKQGTKEILKGILDIFESAGEFTAPVLEDKIREYCEKSNLGAGKVFHPVRVAVSGRMKGPGLFEMLQIIGKRRAIQRIKHAMEKAGA
jgi:glutamyl-tRNA synthetase